MLEPLRHRPPPPATPLALWFRRRRRRRHRRRGRKASAGNRAVNTQLRGTLGSQGGRFHVQASRGLHGSANDISAGHRLVRVGLACEPGRFPRKVIIGQCWQMPSDRRHDRAPVKPGSPPPDFTVPAMIITADAESRRACLIDVQTAENGGPEPLPRSTILAGGQP